MDDLHDDALGDEGEFQAQQNKAENEDEILPPTFPARVNVTVEKPNNGALLIQAVIQDGDLQIEEISHFADADVANAHTAEKDWARQSLYAGPPAENLDPELLAFWGRYLEERGLNLEFQNMVTDYIAFKEQKEYVRWLESKYLSMILASPLLTPASRRAQVRFCLSNDSNPFPSHRPPLGIAKDGNFHG
jgi:complement component 1 Q subcomponent-binding protein